jgi:hypothetical protein
MKYYEIEKGVPLPGTRVKRSRSKYRLGEMKVGESIFIPKSSRASVTAAWGRYKPKEYTSETDQKDPSMVRVWRVK